jgi:hypothetical protein
MLIDILLLKDILGRKAPKWATHFYHAKGYIHFYRYNSVYKTQLVTTKEYLKLKQDGIQPYQTYNLF